LGGIVIDARNRGLLVSGGGHSMACGIGCKIEEWESFVDFLNNKATWIEQPIVVDCKIDIGELDIETVSALSSLEPLGQGMPAVSAFIENFKVREVRKFSNGHIKLISYHRGIEAVWWRAEEGGVDDKLMGLTGKTVSLIGTPEVNSWNDRTSIQIVIQDLVP
jgi:single-stranded-DNA-specific exonuclease